MPGVTVGLTESQIFAAIRSFLLTVLPPNIEVIRGQDNRVPQPPGTDFVVMSSLSRERLATNRLAYFDGTFSAPPAPGIRTDTQPLNFTAQIDVFGPSSADNTAIITTLFRSDYGCTAFAASGYDVTPLYASDPRQTPFTDEEQQQEQRWSIDASVQANIGIVSPQDFAAALALGLIDVDVWQPPPAAGLPAGAVLAANGLPLVAGNGALIVTTTTNAGPATVVLLADNGLPLVAGNGAEIIDA